MVVDNPIFRFTVFISTVLLISFFTIAYLFAERYLTEDEITITVINKEKFGNEDGQYLIFTPNEVFKNFNSVYHRKTNADLLFNKLEMGVSYRVKVVGLYLPSILKLRNITEIIGTDISKVK
ncbi:MAG: hypothetical protein HXY50_04845 [Ignavibacteriaceae bacterium]|nr:hypothetical protein [Ignavibacteriaceae bacterium]